MKIGTWETREMIRLKYHRCENLIALERRLNNYHESCQRLPVAELLVGACLGWEQEVLKNMSVEYRNLTSRITNHDDLVEAARLANKTQLLLRSLGGLLPGMKSSYLEQTRAVLEIGCGPGVWALELARTYPHMQIVAVDPSLTMISYARKMLVKEQPRENIEYQIVPTCIGPFPFEEASFDLVSAQFVSKFLTADEWPEFLSSCRSLLRPGGLLRLTEYELTLSNSSAQEELNRLFVQAMRRAGLSSSVSDRHLGFLCDLEPLLYCAGFQECSTVSHHINYSFGAPAHEEWKKDCFLFAKSAVLPFLVKWGVATREQVETLYHQQYIELNLPTFHGVIPFMTIWGCK